MANPRIDELRRRIEREPGSRLFSQLAEELRKEGDLTEAIRVARAGLAAHPNYPSARLTLGRALFDTGQFGPARIELESVLRGAPDNILAARLLAECLEGLGDPGAALLQYRAAQRLSPDDKQIEALVRSLEQRLAAGGIGRGGALSAPPAPLQPRVAQAAPTPAGSPSPASPMRPSATGGAPQIPLGAAAPSAGIPSAPVDDFDDVFEPAPAWKRSAQAAPAPKEETILLLEDEAPTLPGASFGKEPPAGPPTPSEALDAPQTLAFEEPPLPVAATRATEGTSGAGAAPGADTLAGAPAFFVPPPADLHLPAPLANEPAEPGPASPADQDRAAGLGTSTAAFAAFGATPAPAEALPSKAAPSVTTAPEPPPPASPLAESTPSSADAQGDAAGANLSTPTLAELYCDQGFFDRAVEVYEQILEREPHNERVRARLIEVKALGRALPGATAPDPRDAERNALRRKIARLEQMLLVVRRG